MTRESGAAELLRVTGQDENDGIVNKFVRNRISANMDHKREVWLLRHGATEWSKNGRHTGHTDIPLLPEGEGQAKALAVTLASRNFAKVLVSPAVRARRTCELAGLIGRAEVTEDLWEYGA